MGKLLFYSVILLIVSASCASDQEVPKPETTNELKLNSISVSSPDTVPKEPEEIVRSTYVSPASIEYDLDSLVIEELKRIPSCPSVMRYSGADYAGYGDPDDACTGLRTLNTSDIRNYAIPKCIVCRYDNLSKDEYFVVVFQSESSHSSNPVYLARRNGKSFERSLLLAAGYASEINERTTSATIEYQTATITTTGINTRDGQYLVDTIVSDIDLTLPDWEKSVPELPLGG